MSLFTRLFRPPEEPEERSYSFSPSDPMAARILGVEPSLAGVPVNERAAMGLPAVFACVALISETVAGLPLRTVRTQPDGSTVRVSSWLDEPAGLDGPTAHEFFADIMVSLLLRGNYFAEKVYNSAGQLLFLQTIPECQVSIDVRQGVKFYRVQLTNGVQEFTDREILHIPAPGLDGVRGVSPITLARNMFGTSIAGERTAARFYETGFRPTAVISPTDPSITTAEAEEARVLLEQMASGDVKAGAVALLSKGFNVSQWSVNPADAQWIESRQFQLGEIARWFRVPPHMIGDASGSTSWGSGLAEQTLGFQKFTLQQWTSRIEGRLSRLLPPDHKAAFDYTHLLEGTQAEKIPLLVQQAGGPYRTVNEVRREDNLPPIEGGDVLRPTAAVSAEPSSEVAA